MTIGLVPALLGAAIELLGTTRCPAPAEVAAALARLEPVGAAPAAAGGADAAIAAEPRKIGDGRGRQRRWHFHSRSRRGRPQSVGLFAGPVAVGDLNGDGAPDLAVTSFTGSVRVLLNRGDGTFAPALRFASGGGLQSVAIGDLNGDGKADLAVAMQTIAGNVSVLFNTSR